MLDTQTQLLERKQKKYAMIFIWATFVMYVLMMSSKNIFTAELVTLMDVFKTTKAETSLAMTYYFFTYAIGQFVLSFAIHKINLKMYLTVTAGISAVLTVFMGLTSSMHILYILCGVNGVLQAGIYCGCMESFSKNVPEEMLSFANKLMTIGTATWGVLSYGLPPLFVGHGLWNVPFILLGGLFFVSVIVFFIAFTLVRKYPPARLQTELAHAITQKPCFRLETKKKIGFYFVGMIMIALTGNTANYMIMNWVPNMLHDVFNMPQSYSILITLIVPLISAVGSIVAIDLCQKEKRNIFVISVRFGIISILPLLPMIFLYNKNIVFSILLVIAFVAFGAGSRAVFAGVIAFKMQTQVNAGRYLAMINAVAAVTAGAAPPLAGAMIDMLGVSGYQATYIVALVISIIYILAVVAFIVWNKKENKE